MSLSKHKKLPSYDFPEEILSEIFKSLPVKYVLRCRAVQKSWYHLIKTPMFISQHCNHQKMTAHINPKYLLFDNTGTHLFTVRSDDSQSLGYCIFDYPPILPNCKWYAQLNGLMCVSTLFNDKLDGNPEIYIWNPLVKKIWTVPETPLPRFTYKETAWNALAFGFLPEENDYVVVHMVKPSSTGAPDSPDSLEYFDLNTLDESYDAYQNAPHTVMIGVYSLNSNSWKQISQDKVYVDSMSTSQSVFVNGTAFWIGFNYNVIYQLVMYFDTKTNILRQVEVPCWVVSHNRQLESPLILPFGQSIAYFVEGDKDDWESGDDEDDKSHSPHLDIWVLKDDMIDDDDDDYKVPWEKTMTVKLSENVWAEVLGTRNNGEPIQAKLDNLISYDLDTHEPYDFVKSCDRLTPCYYHEKGSRSPFVIRPFVETLVLLDIGTNVQSEVLLLPWERA